MLFSWIFASSAENQNFPQAKMETLTLPSNSSMDVFPNNTTASYTVELAHPLVIPDDAEIGLAEIQYPHTWYTVPRNMGNLRLRHKNQQGAITVPMPYGMFESQEHFCQALTLTLKSTRVVTSDEDEQEATAAERPVYNPVEYSRNVWRYTPLGQDGDRPRTTTTITTIPGPRKKVQRVQAGEEEFYDISIRFNSVHEKVIVVVNENCVLEMDPKISMFLGFDETSFLPGAPYVGDRVFDISQGLHALYVYCDIIQPRHVGDTQATLLRTIPVDGNNGDRITKIFSKPFFFRCNTRKISKIKIDIKSELGESVPFETSPSEVTLQIRKVKPYEEI